MGEYSYPSLGAEAPAAPNEPGPDRPTQELS